jgi:acylphosphatase
VTTNPAFVGTGRVRRRVLVSGRVQGVWFRESCREQATAAGVSGWVRNLADGRVEVALEGPEPAVARVVAWCGDGPRRARVERIEVVDESPVGEMGFRVH